MYILKEGSSRDITIHQCSRLVEIHAEPHAVLPVNIGLKRQRAQIDLRGFVVAVAEQGLQRERGNAAVEQVHREAVPKRMGRHRHRERISLTLALRDGVTQPVAGGVVRHRPQPVRPVFMKRGEVVTHPQHKAFIHQRHVSHGVGGRASGLAALLEVPQPELGPLRPAQIQANVGRHQPQRLVKPRAGVPQRIEEHPLTQIGEAHGEQHGDLRLEQVLGLVGLRTRQLAHGKRYRVVGAWGNQPVGNATQILGVVVGD